MKWVEIKHSKDLPKKDGKYITIDKDNEVAKFYFSDAYPIKWEWLRGNNRTGNLVGDNSHIIKWLDESIPSTGEDVHRMAEAVELIKKCKHALGILSTMCGVADLPEGKQAANKILKEVTNFLPKGNIEDCLRDDTNKADYSAHPPAPSGMEEAVRGLDNPYPLSIVLGFLIKATEYLLNKNNYDGPDYEEMEISVKRAKEIIANLSASTPPAIEQTSKLPGVDNTQVKPSDPQMVKEVP